MIRVRERSIDPIDDFGGEGRVVRAQQDRAHDTRAPRAPVEGREVEGKPWALGPLAGPERRGESPVDVNQNQDALMRDAVPRPTAESFEEEFARDRRSPVPAKSLVKLRRRPAR